MPSRICRKFEDMLLHVSPRMRGEIAASQAFPKAKARSNKPDTLPDKLSSRFADPAERKAFRKAYISALMEALPFNSTCWSIAFVSKLGARSRRVR